MHNDGAVFAVLGFVYRELSGAVVAELFAHALSVHVSKAVAKYAVRVPVAPDAVPFRFIVAAVDVPEPFACHFAAHTVGIKTAAFHDEAAVPDFFVS